MTTPDTTDIKARMVNVVNSTEGIGGSYLHALLVSEYIGVTPDTIRLAMSEASQDNLVKRVEYKLPDKVYMKTFYIPIGSVIV